MDCCCERLSRYGSFECQALRAQPTWFLDSLVRNRVAGPLGSLGGQRCNDARPRAAVDFGLQVLCTLHLEGVSSKDINGATFFFICWRCWRFKSFRAPSSSVADYLFLLAICTSMLVLPR